LALVWYWRVEAATEPTAAGAGFEPTPAEEGTRAANIILIVADDLGYGDLGCYGQKLIQTPRLDQMAARGMRFTNFNSGAGSCLPSRCTLMTGLHMGHSRIRSNGGAGHHLPILAEDTTLPEVLKAAGYRTGMIGKWAMGDVFRGCTVEEKNQDGPGAVYKQHWDFYFGEPNQSYCHTYFPEHLYLFNRLIEAPAPDGLTPPDALVPYPLDGQYSHDALTDKALAFIDAMKDQRFFLYVPYTVPHFDWVGVAVEPYAAAQTWSGIDKAYASMITRMDRDVGRILDRLAAHGIDRNTLVLFTSDNGPDGRFADDDGDDRSSPFDSNGNLRGRKAQLMDGGVRVPLIAWAPGRVPAGTTNDALFAFWDVLPTLAEVAGIPAPAPLDGLSFLPTLEGREPQAHHDYLFIGNNRRHLIKRAPWETRSDEEIVKDAYTREVVVPEWNPNPAPDPTPDAG
jgi:arylsulfatase A